MGNSSLRHLVSKRYFTNFSWLALEKIFRMSLQLFVGILVARYLGPGLFGTLSYVLSIVAIISPLATLGLDSIVVRNLVNSPNEKDALLGTAFWLKFLAAFFLFVVLAIFYWISSDNEEYLLVFIIASGLIFQSFCVIDFYFQSLVLSKYVVRVQFIQVSISSGLKLMLIGFDMSIVWFAIVALVDMIVLAVGLAVMYFCIDKTIKWRFSGDTAKSLIRDSWPLMFSGIVISIYMKIDQIMVRSILGVEEVGYYAAAVRICETPYFLPMIICSSIFPLIIQARLKDVEDYNKRLEQLYCFVIWLALIITIPAVFLSKWLIGLLFGSDFAPAADVMSIYFWANVFVFIGVASGRWYVIENLQRIRVLNTAVGAMVNVTLNLLLIPQFGIEGAAWASIISFSVAGFFMDALYIRTRPNFFRILRAVNLFSVIRNR